MKILGIGVDLVENRRIKKLINNKTFIKRTFGKNEINFAKKKLDKTKYYAKRFAAKEALVKSLGTGFRNNLNLKDIEILNNRIGKPYYFKNKKINKIVLEKFNIKNFDMFLSMSDEKDYSIAFTILQVK